MKKLIDYINEAMIRVTPKDVFNYICGLNPKTHTSSSLGKYSSSTDNQIADMYFKEVADYLPQDSLAHKILFGSKTYTEKQLWVITYELMKNKDFVGKMEELNAERAEEAEREKSQREGKHEFTKVKREFAKMGAEVPKDARLLSADEVQELEINSIVGVKLTKFKPMVPALVMDIDTTDWKCITLCIQGEKNAKVLPFDCNVIYK